MNRPYFVADEQSIIFPALVSHGELRSSVAVILLADSVIDLSLFTNRIVEFLDRYPEVGEVWVAAPAYADGVLKHVQESADLSKRMQALALGALRTFLIDVAGRWTEVEPAAPSGRDAPFSDDLVETLLESFQRAIFVGTGSLLTAHSGYHFGKPSGAHSKYFLRAAGAVDRRMQAIVLALGVLRRITIGRVRRIWTDTAGVIPVAAALCELRAGFYPKDRRMVADSFGGYAGLEPDFDPRFNEEDAVIISSSTSGGLARRVANVAPHVQSVLTLFAVLPLGAERPAKWLSQVVCSLDSSTSQYDPAVIVGFSSQPARECEMCLVNGEIAVALEGDGFFPATGGVTARPITLQDSSQALQEFMALAAGNGVLRVRHRSASAIPAVKLLVTRLSHIFDESGKEGNALPLVAAIREQIARQFIDEQAAMVVVHLNDEDSAAVARDAVSHWGGTARILNVDDPGLEAVLSEPSVRRVLVVAGVVGGGRGVLNVSRRLRFLPPAVSTAYFIGVAHPESEYAFTQMRQTLSIRGNDPETTELMRSDVRVAFHVFREAFESEDDPWRAESRLLSRLRTREGGPVDVVAARERALLSHESEEYPKSLFLPLRGTDNFPALQKYFVFWGVKWEGAPTHEEVYYTVQCVMHNNRRSGKAGRYALVNDGGDRFVIEPHMFDRFNDPILQAGILRSATTGELDFSADLTLSRAMRSFLEYLMANAHSVQGAALAEFLLSLCLGIEEGRTRHLRLSPRDTRALAADWREAECADRLPPLPAALVRYFIEEVEAGS